MASGGKTTQPASYYDNAANTAVANVATVSPVQQAIDKKAQTWLDWDAQTGPKDVTTAPGYSDELNIYGSADSLANQSQMGGGALNLADSNSGYADQLKQLGSFERFNNRAEGLSDAMKANRAQALGLAQQSISASDAKKLASAQAALQNQSSYYNRPQKQGFWSSLATAGLGAAGNAISYSI